MRADPLRSLAFLTVGILIGSLLGYFIPIKGANKDSISEENLLVSQIPTPETSDTQLFSDPQGRYRLDLPKDWTKIEMGESFPDSNHFQAVDGSTFIINSEETTSENLSTFLASRDQRDLTSWEGKPSRRVIDQLEVEVFGLPAIRRTEHWLAADFQTVNTYSLINGTVYSFYIIPLELPYNQTDAFSKYQEIIDSFEPLLKQSEFKCPQSGWVNCMPILNDVGKKACSEDAVRWYRSNCPGFQGLAM